MNYNLQTYRKAKKIYAVGFFFLAAAVSFVIAAGVRISQMEKKKNFRSGKFFNRCVE